MDLRIDHVTVAGRDLDRLVDAFDEAGFPVEYGGRHSNGVTHMAIVGFRDGSYVELISTLEPDVESPWWDGPIREDGGPCAWAVDVDDIEAASADLRDRGVRVDGPAKYERTREDGTLVEWDLTYLGEGDPGSTLPFLISDRTPRERRVRPTGDLATSPIAGVDTVVLGVDDLDAAVERFGTAFDASDPTTGESAGLDADVASFPDLPVALAAPRGDGPLADRLAAFGPRPVAYLLGYEGDGPGFDDLESGSIGGRPVEWGPVTHPVGRRYLGFVETDS
ncbi:Glyoxalase-like domain-containing protein [Halorubrum aquaticum]|uniref:Glyoxalase-like domain-containing protein n=1 Tax=Halorubrum aquaticum TaxID=387340 RepID=A0A1I2ZJ33_9EURY|nr:VOC family protein [Halorubrum aquaticum]SFH37740.1 Glyoxalase-like domain-containing protein [Halorubrum aquaticum]